MKRIIVTALALVALLAASAAQAQVPRIWRIGIAGGPSLPMSDAKDALDNGYNLQGFVSFALPGVPVGLRASVDYQRYDMKNAAVGVEGTGSVLGGVANASWRIPLPVVTPYLTAGVGAYNTKAEVSSPTLDVSESSTNLGINGGAGAEVHLGGFTAFLEGRLVNIYTDQGWSSGLGSTRSFDTQLFPISVGIIF